MSIHPKDLVLVGWIQKPYGLFGEVKIKPESFDFDRYKKLKTVYTMRKGNPEVKTLEVRSKRADDQFWYLKFSELLTPEAVAPLSGGQLLVGPEDRLDLPEGMVYFSDLPGMEVIDETQNKLGIVVEVMETGAQDFIVVRTVRGDIPVPWNDRFVKYIDVKSKKMEVDVSTLRGTLL